MINDLKPLLSKFVVFAKDRLNFKKPPRLFLKKDLTNSECMLGRTAHYDPAEMSITLFVSKRHPKDIMRSFAHELVHHCQNERGDLAPEKMKTMSKNYAQENEHMRKMEEEAYLQGNMCFRDWEDSLDNKLKYRMHLAEQNYIKENKKMSVKISKKELKGLIGKLLSEQMEFNPAAIRAKVAADNTPAPAPARKRTPPARAPEKSYADKLRDALNQEIPEAEGEIIVTQPDPSNPNYYEVSPIEIVGTIQPEEEEVKVKVNQAVKQEPEVPEAQEIDIKRNPETGIYEVSPIVIFGDPNAPDEEVAEPIQKPQPQRMPEAVGVNEQADPKIVDDKGNPITVTRQKDGSYLVSDIHIVGTPPAPKEKKKVAKPVKKPKPQLKEEEKLNTPEKEDDLYESRFSDRNKKLFEKLLKEWTK